MRSNCCVHLFRGAVPSSVIAAGPHAAHYAREFAGVEVTSAEQGWRLTRRPALGCFRSNRGSRSCAPLLAGGTHGMDVVADIDSLRSVLGQFTNPQQRNPIAVPVAWLDAKSVPMANEPTSSQTGSPAKRKFHDLRGEALLSQLEDRCRVDHMPGSVHRQFCTNGVIVYMYVVCTTERRVELWQQTVS